jgi:hypothetical protein
MTYEGLGEMFEGDSADMCGGKFPLVSMGGRSGGSSVRRPGSEGPHQRQRKLIIPTYIYLDYAGVHLRQYLWFEKQIHTNK